MSRMTNNEQPLQLPGKLRLARAIANGLLVQLHGDNCANAVLFIEISLYEIQDTVFCIIIKYQLSYINFILELALFC